MADDDAPEPDRTVMAVDPTVVAAVSPSAEPLGLQAGRLINNNYRITELISAGGMGEVYRAENVFTGDPVAVKVILPGLAKDQAMLDMFRREARVLVQLRDDSIVRYHNFVLDAQLDRYCLIMEFVEGNHLGARLKAEGPLGDADALALLRRIGTGLARAHERGVTHRDLSPDNVILRDNRVAEAVLIDFGIARSTELGDGLEGRFAGKFKYIAPEQLGHWGGQIGPRTDIYGLALLIAGVARGTPLPMGDSVVSASAMRQAIPDLGGISHRLFPILQHMLEPDPTRRPADMTAVLSMLDDPSLIPSRYRLPLWQADGAGGDDGASATTGSGIGDAPSTSPFQAMAAQPVSSHPPAKPQHRGGRWLLYASLGAVLLAIGLVGWMQLRLSPVAAPAPDEPELKELVARDASTRDGFLAEQPLATCTLAERISAGDHAGQLQVLGRAGVDASAAVAAYGARFGVSPSVRQVAVAPPQCAMVDFLHEISGRPAPAITLDADAQVVNGQLQVRGMLAGAPAGGDRNLWLMLVAPSGEVYDLSSQLEPAQGVGRSFGFALAQDQAGHAGPFLLVALSSDVPVAAAAAAPAGVAAADLMPRVLTELRDGGAAPSMAVLALESPPAQ